MAKELTGLTWKPAAEVLTIKHGVTRYAITLVCVEATRAGGEFAPGVLRRGEVGDAARNWRDYPVSSPQRKLMTELANPNRQRRLF